MENKNISKVIKIVKKEVKKFETPVATDIANKSKDPFKVLISCLLSLRTKDKVTATASKKLFSKAYTPKKILSLKTSEIKKLIYPVGFYKTKAKRIKEICKVLIEKYNGKVPDNMEELLKLKGVGRKTANIVLTYGYNKNYSIAVDTHVHKIANRLGWVKTKTPNETELALIRIIPKKYWPIVNDTFVTFGQNICVPISPFCSKCPVRNYCKRINIVRSR